MYVVLSVQADETFKSLGEFEATDAKAAIRSAAKGATEGGTYIAVPKRSWQPITVRVETRQVVVWDDDSEDFPIPPAGGEHVAITA